MSTLLLPQRLRVAPDRHDPDPLVIYHARCPDGFGAALAAWLYYEGRVQCWPCDHGQVREVADLPPLQGRAVYILDFSFPPAILQAIDAQAAKLVLLDHHVSAARQLSGFACRCGALHFDMDKSGARLAWDYFQPERALPDLIRYIEDRDLWRWQYPQSAAFLAALDMEPWDFERWAEIASFDSEQLAAYQARGQAMDEKFCKLAADLAEQAEPVTLLGERGLMVNAPGVFHSLVGELLAQRCGTFALLWSAQPGGVIKVGLRSQRPYDCLPLAQRMGGGGHAQACGFRLGAERLPELLRGRLDG